MGAIIHVLAPVEDGVRFSRIFENTAFSLALTGGVGCDTLVAGTLGMVGGAVATPSLDFGAETSSMGKAAAVAGVGWIATSRAKVVVFCA